ncbi:hypothetical protein [Actinomadura hibisca]|nr:hypothetical protein [Actinomadura hibisca]
MAKTTTVIHPKRNGTWPNGEPKSVRDAADKAAGGSSGGSK